MTRIAVDTDSLRATVAVIRTAADQAEDAVARNGFLGQALGALGDPGLVSAMHEFLAQWGNALHQVIAEARRLADALDLVMSAYGDLDTALSETILGHAATASGVCP